MLQLNQVQPTRSVVPTKNICSKEKVGSRTVFKIAGIVVSEETFQAFSVKPSLNVELISHGSKVSSAPVADKPDNLEHLHGVSIFAKASSPILMDTMFAKIRHDSRVVPRMTLQKLKADHGVGDLTLDPEKCPNILYLKRQFFAAYGKQLFQNKQNQRNLRWEADMKTARLPRHVRLEDFVVSNEEEVSSRKDGFLAYAA